MNYLVLRGLKKYYFGEFNAAKIYEDLRNNLIQTVCGNLEVNGFLYENYND